MHASDGSAAGTTSAYSRAPPTANHAGGVGPSVGRLAIAATIVAPQIHGPGSAPRHAGRAHHDASIITAVAINQSIGTSGTRASTAARSRISCPPQAAGASTHGPVHGHSRQPIVPSGATHSVNTGTATRLPSTPHTAACPKCSSPIGQVAQVICQLCASSPGVASPGATGRSSTTIAAIDS